jgi:hypothetical protein
MTALTPAERILKSLGIEAPGEIDLEAIAWTRGASSTIARSIAARRPSWARKGRR